MDPVPSSQEAERFRADLERLIGAPVERLGVAVSGGPDSVALLLLANAAYAGRIHAATVDHGLRAESAGEAEFVAELCARLGVPHRILRVEVQPKGEGLQGEARRARYDALAGWAAENSLAAVCTAHHMDDQAETILMRLQRGSGASGLAGVRPVRRIGELKIARPLLGWNRAELLSLIEASGIRPIDDPSNRDPRFERVSVRRFLTANPQFQPPRLARSAASLAEAGEALEWMADLLEAERCAVADGEWRIDSTGLPRELARRLLARAVTSVVPNDGAKASGAIDVEGLLQTLESGGTGTLAGAMASASGPLWRVRP
ncbi:MAG TPA: tRNA lysidine(34) synthetase TilS, partial [Allosphingosinicella sp.]|nr:tRNA lysidine(34) synthetase TilS [Allosphingosinicella sp.]